MSENTDDYVTTGYIIDLTTGENIIKKLKKSKKNIAQGAVAPDPYKK